MLGFRSLFRTHDTPELLDVAAQKLFIWLERKGYEGTALIPGPPVEIGENARGSIQHITDNIGSQTMRARIVENTPKGTWTSELTVHSSPNGNRGWVWLDIHKPDAHGWTATPNLARTLVAAVPARDGAHLLGTVPQLVHERDVQSVVDALIDPGRRGLAFVAGTGTTTRSSEWRDVVDGLLDDTVGLANGWVLTADATEKFNYLVGRSHEATAGFLRTYLPKVAVHDPLDGERHRFLTSASIGRDPVRSLRRILGQRAREQMIATRLPDALRDLDRILRREVDTALLADLLPGTTGVAPARPTPSTPTTSTRPLPTSTACPVRPTPVDELDLASSAVEQAPAPLLEPAPAPVPIAAQLSELLRELVGSSDVTMETLTQLGSMARTSQRADAAREQIGVRFDQLRDEVEEAHFERDLAREDLKFEQLEHLNADEERASAERRLRYTQHELARLDHAAAAWSEPELDIRDIRPDTFVDLLERRVELAYVVFTGDATLTQDLDRHGNPGSWAAKTWEALLALEDYARISTTESYARDVNGFLADTPHGCRSFSANRHAATESDTVQNHPRFRKRRELPVPATVDPTEHVFMGAHFKIAQSTTVSPRLHYFDATATVGLVYVGYIGPHLPTAAS